MTTNKMEESGKTSFDARTITAIYTNIGRGHPSYLDSLLTVLQKRCANLSYRTVFSAGSKGQESKGFSLLSWKLVAGLYLLGGRGGMSTRLYNWLRQSQTEISGDSTIIKILGCDLKRAYHSFDGICLVEHPIVARILADVCRTWYIHGEIAAPPECAIKGIEKIFVPLEETKDRLISFGADPETIVVTGLMIEPGLVETAEKSFQDRLKRIESSQPLTVGFFTSGAYPKEHMKEILWGAKSVIDQKMRAIIFTGTNPKKFELFKKQMKKWGVSVGSVGEVVVENPALRSEPSGSKTRGGEDTDDGVKEEQNADMRLVTRKTRQADTQRAVELLPKIDVFVSASHERTNWAVGLGLPMFVLFPLIGTFASLNFEFAQRQKVTYPLDSLEKAKSLGKIINELRENGQLAQISRNGFGVHKIDGAQEAASQLPF
jgi:hypothetical protein